MNDTTLLLRQVHPSFVQHGRVTSQAFRPTPKDENKLSTYDGDQIDPEAAWTHYTSALGFNSHGVMAVSFVECPLPVVPDPDPFPEHVVIDFSGLNRKAAEDAAKHLRAMATARGWLFCTGGTEP